MSHDAFQRGAIAVCPRGHLGLITGGALGFAYTTYYGIHLGDTLRGETWVSEGRPRFVCWASDLELAKSGESIVIGGIDVDYQD